MTKNNNMAKNSEIETPSINIIGSGTIVEGKVNSNGDFRIDGTLIGSIKSESKIIVGSSGMVEGEINAKNADISGKIKANIQIEELLILKASTNLTGNIKVGKLAIEPGAIFTGQCEMNNEI